MAACEDCASEDHDKNKELQNDEIAALSAIYEDSFLTVDELNRVFEFHIVNSENSWWSLTLQVHLPPGYPLAEVPIHKVFTECMNDADLLQLSLQLADIWQSNKGACILYLWVEAARTMLDELQQSSSEKEPAALPAKTDAAYSDINNDAFKILQANHNQHENLRGDAVKDKLFEFLSGDPLIDRKSTFQAHVTSVFSLEDVQLATAQLKQNRKIQHATHNILAYRIQPNAMKSNYLIDCDDDGEYQAGGRLKHLLQILDAVNIVVIVSRWYGGILLGPDRFKHINNCARDAIMEYCKKESGDNVQQINKAEKLKAKWKKK